MPHQYTHFSCHFLLSGGWGSYICPQYWCLWWGLVCLITWFSIVPRQCMSFLWTLPLCHHIVGVTHICVHKQRKRSTLLAISTIGICFSTAVHCVTIIKFQMTADQSLYVKQLDNVNIYQIDEFFSAHIKSTVTSIRKWRILLQKV